MCQGDGDAKNDSELSPQLDVYIEKTNAKMMTLRVGFY